MIWVKRWIRCSATGLSQYVAAVVIPTATLTSRAEGVFIETGAIPPSATGVALRNVRANGTQRPVELVGKLHRAFIFHELGDIMPAQLRREQGQSISLDGPQWIARYLYRN